LRTGSPKRSGTSGVLSRSWKLERAREYLGYVAQATAAVKGLIDPRQSGNLTAFSKAYAYEQELAGESAIRDTLPTAAASIPQAL
jgi:hypothetical protein